MKSNPFRNKKYSREFYTGSGRKRKFTLKNFFSRKTSDGPVVINTEKKYSKNIKSQKPVYIDSYRKKQRPVWMIPVISVIFIMLLVFWIAPMALNSLEMILNVSDESETENILKYSEGYVVVTSRTADIFKNPDLRSRRISQVIYNDVLKVTDDSFFGFYKVELDEGSEGYIMEKHITGETISVEPSLYTHKITITSQNKRIMSHAASGSLIMEAPMGTTLFSDHQSSNLYRVALPCGNTGWISASGIIRLDPDKSIEKSTATNFYETVLSFNNATYLEGGITRSGASMEGIIYISAKINGVDLPRNMQLQSGAGTNIPLIKDDETGEISYENWQNGDLVFFGTRDNGEILVSDVGVVAGYGQIIARRRSNSSIRIIRLEDDITLNRNVVSVSRIFE